MDWESIIKRDTEAKIDLIEAYTRLFNGKGTPEDAQIVLTDLMSFSGYFNVTASHQNRDFHEGSRSVGARIFTMANMQPWERDALYGAARRSSIIDQVDGEI